MGYQDHASVSELRYESPYLSDIDPIYLHTSHDKVFTPKIDAGNIAYHSLFEPFNLEQLLYPRPPIDMGLVDLSDNQKTPNVLRMPIKFPGTYYRIPREMKNLLPLLKRVLQYEESLHETEELFVHMTHDYSMVESGKYHRFPGLHCDGLQGTKITPKVIAEHSYIVATNPPTEYCLQPFFLKHLDEAKHNFFLEFDRQAHEANIYQSLSGHLYLIDPYMVHRSPKMNFTGPRRFIRITFAFTELQHPKNTKNPLFIGQKYEKRVDIRENLSANEFEVPYHLYGLKKD